MIRLIFTFFSSLCFASQASASNPIVNWSAIECSAVSACDTNSKKIQYVVDSDEYSGIYFDKSISLASEVTINRDFVISGAGFLRSRINLTSGGKISVVSAILKVSNVYIENDLKSIYRGTALVDLSGMSKLISNYAKFANPHGYCINGENSSVDIQNTMFRNCKYAVELANCSGTSPFIDSSSIELAKKNIGYSGFGVRNCPGAQFVNNHIYGWLVTHDKPSAYIRTDGANAIIRDNFFESQHHTQAINIQSTVSSPGITEVFNNTFWFLQNPDVNKNGANINVNSANIKIHGNLFYCDKDACTRKSMNILEQVSTTFLTAEDNTALMQNSIVDHAPFGLPSTLKVNIIGSGNEVLVNSNVDIKIESEFIESCSINNGTPFEITSPVMLKPVNVGHQQGAKSFEFNCVKLGSPEPTTATVYVNDVWPYPTLNMCWYIKGNENNLWNCDSKAPYGSDVVFKWQATHADHCISSARNGEQAVSGTEHYNLTFNANSSWQCFGAYNGSERQSTGWVTRTMDQTFSEAELKMSWCPEGRTGNDRWTCGSVAGNVRTTEIPKGAKAEFHWEAPNAVSCTNGSATYANNGKKGPWSMTWAPSSTWSCIWPDGTWKQFTAKVVLK